MTQHTATSGVIYWFRNDLRLHDNPALTRAVEVAVKSRHLAEVRSGLQEGDRLVTGERPARSGPQRFKL